MYFPIFSKLQQFEEAMLQYDQVTMPTTFNDLCSLGYACYKSGKYKESYQGTFWMKFLRNLYI